MERMLKYTSKMSLVISNSVTFLNGTEGRTATTINLYALQYKDAVILSTHVTKIIKDTARYVL